MSHAFDLDRLLDEVGRAVLLALQHNARLPMSELARQVGLSAPAVAERVRRLEEAGVIRGYRAEVNPAALGLHLQAYIRLTLRFGLYDSFAGVLHTLPEVLTADRVTGEDCYVLKVAVRDVAHLEAVINALKAHGEPVTSLILSSALPGPGETGRLPSRR